MKKILVVDDEGEIRDLLETRLKANGYDVVTASDGVEGLVKAKDEKPNLIILDVSMPNMDGYSFIRELQKENLKNIPVLVFTARPHLQDLFKIEGIHNYMIKPFNADEFLSKVKDLIK